MESKPKCGANTRAHKVINKRKKPLRQQRLNKRNQNYYKKFLKKKELIKKRALECLKMVNMDKYSNRLTTELSGGQKRRVAIVRALAIDPKVIYLMNSYRI